MRQSAVVFIFGLIFLFFVGYLLFRFQDFWRGPDPEIFYPEEGSALSSSHVLAKGASRAVSSLLLNGRPIYTDESGYFEEELILAPGLNVIELRAKSRFGREFVERRIVMVKLPE
ncbi:MAG: hypothetical protein HY446_00910 [Candidatus Niyogibacteria bacterium]|nr:hypothetical protein [Candidatus Niyogibacteria bacterium]